MGTNYDSMSAYRKPELYRIGAKWVQTEGAGGVLLGILQCRHNMQSFTERAAVAIGSLRRMPGLMTALPGEAKRTAAIKPVI